MERKAVFFTKIVGGEDLTEYNNQVVTIVKYMKGKDIYNDRYTIEFLDGKIATNIMSCELNFDSYDIEIAEIKTEIKKITKKLSYIRKRDRICCVFGSDNEYEELIERRKQLRKELR